MNDIKVKIDSPTPSRETIQKHKNFDRFMDSYRRYYSTGGIREILGPRLCTGLGPLGTTRMRFSSLSGPFSGIWGRFTQGCLQIPTHQLGVRLVDARLIEHAHERGLQVHVWTIDEHDEMRRLLDLGVDGVMTDRPEVLKSVLLERGDWR